MKKPEVKTPEVKKITLKEPNVKEFGDAFLTVKPIMKNENEHINNAATHACVSITKAFGVDPDKLTKEQAFVIFDQFMFVAAFLYAYIVKNPKEV